MASIWTNKGLFLVVSQALDFDTDSGVKIMLLKNSYTPSKDHDFTDDLAASEADASGYTGGFNGAGRKALGSRSITEDDTNDRVALDAADPSAWTLAAGNTLRYAGIIKEDTQDDQSPVICVLDMGGDKITNGGDLTLQFDSAGIATIST